ncbi:MAG: hypothetical protein JWO05_3608 [Gemmatimonadetes bacterium]|nr:hypothetical protein [Gemmatimonadota bacterium]
MRGLTSSFPDTYAALDTTELLHAFEAGPARLRLATIGLTPAERAARPIPGKWSVNELIMHVVDSELMGATRIRLAFTSPGIAVPGYDQERWAAMFDYQDSSDTDVREAFVLFEALRRHSLSVFARLAPHQWSDAYVEHAEHGPVTMRNLLELYADHSERHLAQLLARRELLGRPLDLPCLLPGRLY